MYQLRSVRFLTPTVIYGTIAIYRNFRRHPKLIFAENVITIKCSRLVTYTKYLLSKPEPNAFIVHLSLSSSQTSDSRRNIIII